jgi:hypothetical protein
MKKIFFVFCIFFAHSIQAQKIEVSSLRAGLWVTEIKIGGTPEGIAAYMQNPAAQLERIAAFENNVEGSHGYTGGGPQNPLYGYYLALELRNPNWQRTRLQTGLFLSNALEPGGPRLLKTIHTPLEEELHKFEDYTHSFEQHIQFGGFMLGVHQRYPVGKYFDFFVGLEGHFGFAIKHHFTQTWEERTRYNGAASEGYPASHNKENLPQIKGKNYWHTQARLPLGFSVNLGKVSLCASAFAGLRFDRLNGVSQEEAHGLDFSLAYNFK